MPVLLLGVTGGIAAYKAAELASLLRKDAWDVHVVMTEAACEFISPLTLATLTRNRVHVRPFEADRPQVDHVDLARSADVVAVVPATADLLARHAAGMADDLLTTLLLATTAPVLVAPAMNPAMWDHPAVQANLETLRARGVGIVPPVAGEVACGEVGVGKLAPVEVIAEAIRAAARLRVEDGGPAGLLAAGPIRLPSATLDGGVEAAERPRDLQDVWVLVTAGGTVEPVDPVRVIGNRSSGKMGHAIAREAARRGARVTLITAAPYAEDPQAPLEAVVQVETSRDLEVALARNFPGCDVLVMAAAVSDYRPAHVEPTKHKGKAPWTLELVPTPDLLAGCARERRPDQLLVGFAAETGDAEAEARRKLQAKGVDLVVANDVSADGIGFGSDDNAVTVVGPEGVVLRVPRAPKAEVASRLLDVVARRLPARSPR